MALTKQMAAVEQLKGRKEAAGRTCPRCISRSRGEALACQATGRSDSGHTSGQKPELRRAPRRAHRSGRPQSRCAVSWGAFRPEENKVLPKGHIPGPEHEVREGDLLISRSNTSELVGATVLVGKTRPRLMLSDKTLRIVLKEDLACKSYLCAGLRSPAARAFIEERATGASSSMKNISQETIRAIPLVLPPLSRQRELAAFLEERSGAADRLSAAIQGQLAAIDALPAALVPGVRGETVSPFPYNTLRPDSLPRTAHDPRSHAARRLPVLAAPRWRSLLR